jgi:SAM-dependent methyltransferase
MIDQPLGEYHREIAEQRVVWQAKPSLRTVYRSWYARIVASLSDHRPVVEIGSGCGNFHEFFPESIATDVVDVGEWITRTVDARSLPFSPGEVGNFVMIDVLHHLQRPIEVLRSASALLPPGGRIVLLEPAGTPWARLVFGAFHHEPLDFDQDVFAEDGTPEPTNDDFSFANQAFATMLFVRDPDETMRRLPNLTVVATELSDFVVYPATGGFSHVNLVPNRLTERLLSLERHMPKGVRERTGMRLLVILERIEDRGPG